MRSNGIVSLGLLLLVVIGAGCAEEAGTCARGRSEARTFQAQGQLTARLMALACTEHRGERITCPGTTEEPCCRFDFDSAEPAPGSPAEYRCHVRAVPSTLPAGGDLPTLVEVACPYAEVAFTLPDLRLVEVGTSAITLPVVEWEDPGPLEARARTYWQDCCVGSELPLQLEVLEKTGAPRGSGAHLATDDFAVKVQVEGSIPATVPDGATAEMTISLELTQTAEDYPDAGCE